MTGWDSLVELRRGQQPRLVHPGRQRPPGDTGFNSAVERWAKARTVDDNSVEARVIGLRRHQQGGGRQARRRAGRRGRGRSTAHQASRRMLRQHPRSRGRSDGRLRPARGASGEGVAGAASDGREGSRRGLPGHRQWCLRGLRQLWFPSPPPSRRRTTRPVVGASRSPTEFSSASPRRRRRSPVVSAIPNEERQGLPSPSRLPSRRRLSHRLRLRAGSGSSGRR